MDVLVNLLCCAVRPSLRLQKYPTASHDALIQKDLNAISNYYPEHSLKMQLTRRNNDPENIHKNKIPPKVTTLGPRIRHAMHNMIEKRSGIV